MKKFNRLTQGLFAAVVLIGWTATIPGPLSAQVGSSERVTQPDPPAAAPKGLRVFYASHSLMWYVPKPLGEMAEAAGIKGHQLVGLQSLGASRTLQHWNLADDKNEAKKALKTGEVDVFVMSPISFPDEGIQNFVKLGLEHNPHMRFIVQLSWGGGDIDNQDFPNGAFDNVDKEKTTEQLKRYNQRNIKAGEAQADAINEKFGNGKKILALVPSVQAMVTLRSKIAEQQWPGLTRQSELFVDPVHPSAPLEALNSYLHFAVLYEKSPVGLPLPDMLKNPKREAWNDKFNHALQELAWETVTNYPHTLVGATKE
ncbi:hypothetical protein [Schlesneria sp. DSM 10557]|uniref:hypothetical protein n=1 Tax=Schlesneria sp. DSM 10557 TaxID=3044399 RepID=UPI0035A180D9